MGVDTTILKEKLCSLERCLKRIEIHLPEDVQSLEVDFDKQDIINLNLQRAVQISVDIALHILSEEYNEQAKTMGEAFLLLSVKGIIEKTLAQKLVKSVSFRNIAVYEYHDIDMNILYAIVTKELGCFYDFSRVLFYHFLNIED